MNNPLNKDMLEHLFENKNKGYGAFPIRKSYSRYKLVSFFIALFLVTGAFAYPLVRSYLEKEDEDDPSKMPVSSRKVVNYSEMSAPPPIEAITPTPEELEAAKAATQKFLPPVVKKDEEVIDEELLPTLEDLAKADPGETTEAGSDSIVFDEREFEDVALPPPPPPPPPPVQSAPVQKTEARDAAEVMPSFPGGVEELYNWINNNIEYPKQAIDAQIEGRVVIRFTVGIDGSLSNPEVLKGIGGGCDEEVIKLVSKMPKWEPGQQSGKVVPVRFILPVSFKLQEI